MKPSLYHCVGRAQPELTPLRRRVILNSTGLMQTVCHLGIIINSIKINYLYLFCTVP
jgi:hypothetical protein